MIKANSRIKEHSFYWGKQFGFLTLTTSNSKLEIINLTLKIEIEKIYFGFIKGRKITYEIPINTIDNMQVKTKMSPTAIMASAIFFLAGIFLTPFLFLLVPVSVYACINSNVIIATKKNEVYKIPSSNKKDAKEFIQYFYEIYI